MTIGTLKYEFILIYVAIHGFWTSYVHAILQQQQLTY